MLAKLGDKLTHMFRAGSMRFDVGERILWLGVICEGSLPEFFAVCADPSAFYEPVCMLGASTAMLLRACVEIV